MIHAAGIYFLDSQGQALFLQRGMDSDHPGEWCFPGGVINQNETVLDAAIRETLEETGYVCSPESCKEYTRRIRDDVDFTTFISYCENFKPQLNYEHQAFKWANPKTPPQPLHPGCEIVLKRHGMNELDIANAIKQGELASPQKYENIWLFDMRITGTGLAYRHRFEEFAWRDKSLYLNNEFLQRCNGLPVILEHPPTNTLNSKEYKERNVGSVFLPYIKGDEVWGIVKIWDEPTAQLAVEERLSTSPAVVWRDPNANLEAELETGEKFLIEGKPSLLDHLAICEQGVWDKGGGPTGISTANGVTAMPDEVRKDEKAAADSAAEHSKGLDVITNLLQGLTTSFNEKFTSLVSRIDSVESKLLSRKDATPKNKVLNDDDDDDRKDAEENLAKKGLEKTDDDGEKPRKVPDALPPPFAKKDAKRKDDDDDDRKDDDDDRKDDDDDDDRKDADMPGLDKRKDAKRKDSKRKDDDDDDDRKDDAGDPKKLAADKKKRGDDDDDDDRKDSRGDSIKIKRSDWDAIQKRLDTMDGRIPKALTDADWDTFAQIQSRADTVFAFFGKSAPRPINGETPLAYRRRLLTTVIADGKSLKDYSPNWKASDLRVVAVDEAAFNVAESEIFRAASDAARNPSSVPLGTLREHVETRGGHTYHRFYGRPVSWMAPFAPTGRRVKRINQPGRGGQVNA